MTQHSWDHMYSVLIFGLLGLLASGQPTCSNIQGFAESFLQSVNFVTIEMYCCGQGTHYSTTSSKQGTVLGLRAVLNWWNVPLEWNGGME